MPELRRNQKNIQIVMKNFRVEEAIARAKDNGVKVFKNEVAARLWPESTEATQRINMSNLCSGRLARIKPEWALIICDICGVSLDFLFGKES